MFGSSIEISREICQISERWNPSLTTAMRNVACTMFQAPRVSDRTRSESETPVVGEIRCSGWQKSEPS